MRIALAPADLDIVMSRVAFRPTGDQCWEWLGRRANTGYGVYRAHGTSENAHVILKEIVDGPAPEGYERDHLCENKLCVRPSHIEYVPRKGRINTKRHWLRKTHCARGHEWNDENTHYNAKGQRKCIPCWKAAQKRWAQEHNDEVNAKRRARAARRRQ